ncbi:MAG: hypothetical protein IT463_13095 [Planctomycetes bacterium]|nr:hypothetical protein [Planctomycetota bacterium]
MRTARVALLLPALLALLAPALVAGHGDFSPRGSLLYARAKSLEGALKRLGGEDWVALVERALATRRKRDFDESEPIIAELRRFLPLAGETEVTIADIMVREPNVQLVAAISLPENAPKEFSAEFRDWLVKEVEVKPEPTRFEIEEVCFVLKNSHLYFTIGGRAEAHVEDVLAGNTSDSLSGVERFRKWSEAAKGDVVMWSDMKAWRTAIDRLGERMHRDMLAAFELVEWQKWDVMTASLDLGGPTSSLRLQVDLTFSEPLERAGAFLKSPGAFELSTILPAETLMFAGVQLGNNHLATFEEMLRIFHDVDQNSQGARLRSEIEWLKEQRQALTDELAALEARKAEKDKDKDETAEAIQPGSSEEPLPPEEEDLDARIADVKERLGYIESQIAENEQRLAEFRTRPFEADREARKDASSDAEEFNDGLTDVLARMGVSKEDLAQAIGDEAIFGLLGDELVAGMDMEDLFESRWFVQVEMRQGYQSLKDKMLDWVLGRKLGPNATEEEKQQARERAEELLFKKVDGGEVLMPSDAFTDVVFFFGERFLGFAPDVDVAKRVLANSLGATARGPAVPGGAAGGTAFAYADLGKIIKNAITEELGRDRRNLNFPMPFFDPVKVLAGGLDVGVSLSAGANMVSLTLDTAGQNSLRPTLEILGSELELDRAWRHDRNEVDDLADGVRRWVETNAERLSAMPEGERAAARKALTLETLLKEGFFTPTDGLRSAFDPAMADRFAAMLKARGDKLGDGAQPAKGFSESGYEWYGLPPYELDGTSGRDYWEGMRDGWLVCAMKGPWARGGRVVVLLNGSYYRTAWLSEEDFNALASANKAGNRLPEFAQPQVKVPLWAVRRQMRNQKWESRTLAERLDEMAAAAAGEGRQFALEFDGSREQNAGAKLRELMGLTDDDWLNVQEPQNLEIHANASLITVRFKKHGQWYEVCLNRNAEGRARMTEKASWME